MRYYYQLPHLSLFFPSSFAKMSLLSKSSHRHQYEAIPDDQHIEHHFESPEIIRDIVLGLSDGLTV